MDRSVQRIGLLNLLTLLVVTLASVWVARYAQSATGEVATWLFGLGFLIAAISNFQMRLEAREQVEQLEFEELKKAGTGGALFSQEEDTFPARRSRQLFERFFVPALTVLICGLFGFGAYWLWQPSGQAAPPYAARAPIAMALYGMFALFFLLLGKYSMGIARLENHKLLRPSASYMLLGWWICLVVILTEGAAWFDIPQIDYYGALLLCALMGLTAVELLVTLVFEIYRPRIKGQAARVLYESRLIGLLSQPGGLFTAAAQALDYQFGFKVSETWFFRFLERALAWLVLAQLGILFISTTLVIVEPHEQVFLERFGKPAAQRSILSPGLHWKWPWPIDKVYRYNTGEIQSFYVGFEPHTDFERENTLLWTQPHYRETEQGQREQEVYNLLVASQERGREGSADNEQAVPVNLLLASIPVQYRITNVLDWAYQHQDAGALLERLATREVVRYMVSVDMENIMSSGRLEAAVTLQQAIQNQAERHQLGAEIVFVGLQDIHPPVGSEQAEVARAYEEVNVAMQEKQTAILTALGNKAEMLPQAQAEAARIVRQAKGENFTRSLVARAQAGQFTNQLTAYQASPSVYTNRSYLEMIGNATADTRKIVVTATNTQDVLQLNLEDQIREELWNVGPEGEQ